MPSPSPRGNQRRTGMVDEFLRVVHGELVDGGLVDGPRLDLVQVRHDDRHVVLLVVPEQKRLWLSDGQEDGAVPSGKAV